MDRRRERERGGNGKQRNYRVCGEKRETNKTESVRGREEREEQRVVSGFHETFGRQNLNGEASFTVVSSAGESSRFFTTRE